MDHFGRAELEELLIPPRAPAISIYLPTHRTGRETEADRRGFRNAVDRVRELLDARADVDARAADDLLDGLDAVARDPGFWLHQADGLAVFRAPDFARLYRLPGAEFREHVSVASSFHTLPLVGYLQRPDAYWVLDLAEKRVRLWRGWAGGVAPLDLRGLPRTLREALGIEFERDYPIVVVRKETTGAHGAHGRGGVQPVFHGHGVGPNDDEPERRRFYLRIDRALRKALNGSDAPLVLAAVEDHQAGYRAVSQLDNLAPGRVEADVRDWSAERLHEAAWPVAVAAWDRTSGDALSVWESAYKLDKTETDPASIGRLAVASRVRLLFIAVDCSLSGTLDRETGRLEVTASAETAAETSGAGRTDPAYELVDDLAETVLRRGGRVLVLSADRMPAPELAAVLR